MFTSVIGALTSGLPQYVIWGAYVPVLIFSFVNGGLAYLLWAPARYWTIEALKLNAPLAVGAAFVFTVAAAYVVSAVNDFLRRFLEGAYVWPPILRSLMIARQQEYRSMLQRKHLRYVEQRYEFEQVKPPWEDQLREAASFGVLEEEQLRKDAAAGVLVQLQGPYVVPNTATRGLDRLRALSAHPARVTIRDAQRAVNRMATQLRRHSKLLSPRLSRDHKELLLLDAIQTSVLAREQKASLELNVRFSGDTPSPTHLGNIADAMEGYATMRYGIDLTVLMSRLQASMVKNGSKDFQIVLDSKTQLDFLVACCCFSAITAILWMLILAAFRGAEGVFIAFAIGAPTIVWLLYRATIESYLAYAVAVRSCVDVNRFALLRALGLPLPTTLNGERRLWHTLSAAAASGYTAEISYKDPGK